MGGGDGSNRPSFKPEKPNFYQTPYLEKSQNDNEFYNNKKCLIK